MDCNGGAERHEEGSRVRIIVSLKIYLHLLRVQQVNYHINAVNGSYRLVEVFADIIIKTTFTTRFTLPVSYWIIN